MHIAHFANHNQGFVDVEKKYWPLKVGSFYSYFEIGAERK